MDLKLSGKLALVSGSTARVIVNGRARSAF
jgi:hypothetical protein